MVGDKGDRVGKFAYSGLEQARLQGQRDREAGNPCQKLKAFLRKYHHVDSPESRQMWDAYLQEVRKVSTGLASKTRPVTSVRRSGRRGSRGDMSFRAAAVEARLRTLNGLDRPDDRL